MEVAKAGEMLIRAAYRNTGPSRQLAGFTRHCRTQQQHSSRAFTTSLPRRADDASQPQKQQPRKPGSATFDISSMLDGALDGTKGTPTSSTGRTSRFASNTAQSQNRNPPPQPGGGGGEAAAPSTRAASSFDDIMGFMERPPPPTSSSSSNRTAAVSRAIGGAARAPPSLERPGRVKLNSTVGRMVHVNKEKGFDVARAFRSMEILVARNGVRRDFNKQRFHERGGTKRKRLKSERWRKNFKEGFRAVVRRVLKMRKQGW